MQPGYCLWTAFGHCWMKRDLLSIQSWTLVVLFSDMDHYWKNKKYDNQFKLIKIEVTLNYWGFLSFKYKLKTTGSLYAVV
jgi:hypothetical protein